VTVAQGFQFAPTEKKHTVANEIAHPLKAHGYIKSKQQTPGGHYTFEHPSGHKVHVGPAFPNQTYSKGWRHSEGVGGTGGNTLEAFLNTQHGKKEVALPEWMKGKKKTEVISEEKPKPAPSRGPLSAPPAVKTVLEHQHQIGNMVAYTDAPWSGDYKTELMVDHESNSWTLWKEGQGQVASGKTQLSLNEAVEKHLKPTTPTTSPTVNAKYVSFKGKNLGLEPQSVSEHATVFKVPQTGGQVVVSHKQVNGNFPWSYMPPSGGQPQAGDDIAVGLKNFLETLEAKPTTTVTPVAQYSIDYVNSKANDYGLVPVTTTPTHLVYNDPKHGGTVSISKNEESGYYSWEYHNTISNTHETGEGINGALPSFLATLPEETTSTPTTTTEVKADTHLKNTLPYVKNLSSGGVVYLDTPEATNSTEEVAIDNDGNWTIWKKGEGTVASGYGQEGLNNAFEMLHPRGPGGKFAKKTGGEEEDIEAALAKVDFNEPIPTSPSPPPTVEPSNQYAHSDPKVNTDLSGKGFTPVSTMSTTKAKYVNNATGSKVYITKQDYGGGHNWIYYPPGQPYDGINGTGLENILPTIAQHETPPKVVISHTLNQSDLKKIGPQKGSNPGGTYEDPNGNTYYIKQPSTNNHSRNEFLAAALFGLAGGNTFTYHQVVDGDRLNVGTEWQTLSKGKLDEFSSQEREAAKQDFALHAWIANWDAVGLEGGNNIGIDQDGNVLAQDFGGSLLFRAQGQPKGTKFNDLASEWESLRQPSENAEAASLYADMTQQELKQSAQRLQNISADAITNLVNQYSPGGANDKAAMVDTLVKRRDAILAKVGLVANSVMSGKEQIVQPKTLVPPAQIQESHDVALAAYIDQQYNTGVSALYSKAYAELGTHAPTMDYATKDARDQYKGVGYQSMNDTCRYGNHPNSDSRVKLLTDYFAKTELPADMILTRRLREPFATQFLKDAFNGYVFRDKGFMSASLDPEKMKSWGPVTLVIATPKGTKAAWINNDGESEILFQRGITYVRVLDFDEKNKRAVCQLYQEGEPSD
jgi:hypothetical protein